MYYESLDCKEVVEGYCEAERPDNPLQPRLASRDGRAELVGGFIVSLYITLNDAQVTAADRSSSVIGHLPAALQTRDAVTAGHD